MKRATILLLLCAVLAPYLHAQDYLYERDMERAHPTPAEHSAMAIPMVPFIEEQRMPTLFLNVNMIGPENDQLPTQNESSIAVNPRNPQQLIGSAVDYRGGSSTWAYYSTDAGRSWQNVTLGTARQGWTSSNDPSVCFDHRGKGYLMYGGFKRTGNVQSGENGIFVSSTTDGGKTWGMQHTAVIIHTGSQTPDSSFEDKYYIHADTASSSPHRGVLYTPWKRVINRDSSTQIMIAKSTDEGATWSAPVAVSERFSRTSEATTFGQSFPLTRTGPEGSVHVVWNSGTESAIRYARSTDGGSTFSVPRIVQTYKPFGIKSTINGQSNSRVKTVVRAECYPTLSIDNTGGPRNGWMYLVWAADNYPNVYFSRSSDAGQTWSAARIIHSDTTNDQFWSWVSVDPTTGDVAVMYSDSRDDAANILVRTYVSWSSDGGTTWTDRRVGDGNSDLRNNPFAGNTFAGDYSGCDFFRGKVYPSWVDMRNTTTNKADNDVYTAIVNVHAPASPQRFTAATIPIRPTEIALSWDAVTERAFGQPLSASNISYHLYRDGAPLTVLAGSTRSHTDTGLEKYKKYTYTLFATTTDLADTSAAQVASAFAGGSKQPAPPVALSAKGTESPFSIITSFTTPSIRLDSINPLVNLMSLGYTASEINTPKFYRTIDTGRVVIETLAVLAQGWYRISAVAIDEDGNYSPTSDTLTAYTGWLETNSIPFTDEPRFLTLNGPWGRTTQFYRTAPASFAYAPNAAYQPNRRDTLLLYPYRRESAVGQTLKMSMDIAAFVDQTDTMFLESAPHLEGPWTSQAWWNASKDARWADTTKSDDAWRRETISFAKYNGDTIYTRLRFRSNASRQSDGFFIDDITWDVTSGVNDSPLTTTKLSVAPNPAASFCTIALPEGIPIEGLRTVNLLGDETPLFWYQVGSTVVMDVRDIASGSYIVSLRNGTNITSFTIQVLQ